MFTVPSNEKRGICLTWQSRVCFSDLTEEGTFFWPRRGCIFLTYTYQGRLFFLNYPEVEGVFFWPVRGGCISLTRQKWTFLWPIRDTCIFLTQVSEEGTFFLTSQGGCIFLTCQGRVLLSDLSGEGAFFWPVRGGCIFLTYQGRVCFSDLSGEGAFFWPVKGGDIFLTCQWRVHFFDQSGYIVCVVLTCQGRVQDPKPRVNECFNKIVLYSNVLVLVHSL